MGRSLDEAWIRMESLEHSARIILADRQIGQPQPVSPKQSVCWCSNGRRMPKGPSKSAAAIQRLLEERRQYEAWLARITATADSAPEHVRTRVRAD